MATLLPDGRVLITGGEGLDPEDLSTAELWDPATVTFGPAEALARPRPEPIVETDTGRTGESTTLLPDGRALVVGGTASEDAAPLADAQILDPATEAFVPAGTLVESRTDHTATFLRDGRVLVVGGTGTDGPLGSAELWTSSTRPAKCLGKQPTLIAQPGMELIGSRGNDVIAGSVGVDLIRSGGGNDRIRGYGGADLVDGGAGNDIIDGGPGADRLLGGAGTDRLDGAGGDDWLDGGKGTDACDGGPGTDWLPSCNERHKTRGSIFVTRNTKLKGPHKGRFEIGKDGVTLDCGGHTVTGAGRNVEGTGVVFWRRKGATVKNCDFRDHQDGVVVAESHRNSIIDNRVSRVDGGYIVVRSNGNKLIGNHLRDSTQWFGYGIFEGSKNNRFRGNTSVEARGNGFAIGDSSKNSFIGNVSRDSHAKGFSVEPPSPGNRSAGNVFQGNSALGNRDQGFWDSTNGFRGDSGTDNRYSDNTCEGNGSESFPGGLCD